MNPLVSDLLQTGLSLEETHASWVFLGTSEVWKIKKPVSLGFLDFSTPDKRRAACEAEIVLNRRFAPAVYLDVVPVTVESGHYRLGGNGAPVDWAVHMRRMPAGDRADRRLETGRLLPVHLQGLAERLAEFHAHARCDAETEAFGAPAAVATNATENFSALRASGLLDTDPGRWVETWQTDFVRTQADRFLGRMQVGKIRDGHGDIRLQQVYFDAEGRATLLDCIEFGDRFRFGDTAGDVAFLAMDLEFRGRRDLAEIFLTAYARAAGDFDLYAVVDFYASYRAAVRAKVAWLRPDPDEARAYLHTARDCTRHRDSPLLLAVGGGLGTGKSTLSNRLGEMNAVPVIDSDRTRKQMLRRAPAKLGQEALWSGVYAEAQTERVYAEVLRRAEVVLRSGRSLVVDASFRRRSHRLAARQTAAQRGARFLFLECRADPEVCRARLHQRALSPNWSDGRAEIAGEFLEKWEAVEELPADEYRVLDTSATIDVAELSRTLNLRM